MRLSAVILPIYEWSEAGGIWSRAEDLGFHAGYTYDHLRWQSFRDRPWFGSVPTLAAAATTTHRMRIGTLVTSPNFRHPVTLAKDLLTLDHLAEGRLTVGIGAGGSGFDATALGQEPWSPSERADRLDEWIRLLDMVLTQPSTTVHGRYYSAIEARTIPACLQLPRVPFLVAATGTLGLRLAAEFGQGWVTYGDPRGPGREGPSRALDVVRAQLARLAAACTDTGREYSSIDKVLLQGLTSERPLESVDAFVDWAGRYQAVGIDELVLHWPVPESVFASDPEVFERIATEGLAQLT
jgi:alkanesulfonate monooxygenase SsuD/methylene tetrahydromethanopterin reductase-like flavin-dependent oxidoreductase (luciferase family)